MPYSVLWAIEVKNKMPKIIRVKIENSKKVSQAIPGSTITTPPPYKNPIWADDEPSLLPATGMVGLVLPERMSGNKAHKIISQVTTSDPSDRVCTCGSSQSWVNCSSGSNYCG
jgi:hypothetical protein